MKIAASFFRRFSQKQASPNFNEFVEHVREAVRAEPTAMQGRLSAQFEKGHNSLGASTVPEELQAAISQTLKGYPRRQLRQDVASLSESYARMTKISSESLLDTRFEDSPQWSEVDRQAVVQFLAPAVEYGPKETFAYLASQMPFMLAPLQRVFADLHRRLGDGFAPKSVLDFGCGPGTSMFAANAHWSSSISRAMGVDVSQSMLDLAAELVKYDPALAEKLQLRRFMSMNPDRPKYDLVTCSNVLSEMADESLRSRTVQELWAQTSDILVLIERGNAEGFRILRNARSMLLKSTPSECHIVAPVRRNCV